jgi:hypothetical protein
MLPCLAQLPGTCLPTGILVPGAAPDGQRVEVMPDQCAVCMESLGDPLLAPVEALQCGGSRYQHQFHLRCIVQWYEKNGSCPICREPMNGEERARFSAYLAERAPTRPLTVFGPDDLRPFNETEPGFVPGSALLPERAPTRPLPEQGQDDLDAFNEIQPGFVPGRSRLYRTRPVPRPPETTEETERALALFLESMRLHEARQEQRLAELLGSARTRPSLVLSHERYLAQLRANLRRHEEERSPLRLTNPVLLAVSLEDTQRDLALLRENTWQDEA